MTIRFSCTCGQPLAAPDQYAGQTVRCTTCNEVQVVPASASSDGAPVWEPEGDGLDGQGPRSTPGGWRTRLGQAAGVVLLLAGVAGLWWLFFRGDSASSAEYDLVPRDALAFFTVKVSDVLKNPDGARGGQLIRQLPDSDVRMVEQELGLKLEDIDRWTTVLYDFEQTSWTILHTVRDCDPERIIKSNFGQETTHQGRNYYVDFAGKALLFIDNRTLVIGSEPAIQRCLEMSRRQSRGPLTPAIEAASRNEQHAVAGVNVPRLRSKMRSRREERRGFDPEANELQSMEILDAEALTATAAIAGKVEVEVRVDFRTAETAARVVKAMPAQIQGARLVLMLSPWNPRLGVDAGKLKTLAAACLDRLEPKQEGKQVRFRLGIEVKELLALLAIDEK